MPVQPLPASPSRRTVLTAASWTAPAVLLSAPSPAFALSPGCAVVAHAFDWTHGVTAIDRRSHVIDSVPASAGVSPVTMTITTAFRDGTPTSTHLSRAQLRQSGDLAVADALKLALTKPGTVTAHMDVHIRFSAPVEGLSFVLTDIDSNAYNNQADRVWISAVNGSAPRTVQFERASTSRVLGAGTAASPWTNPSGNSTDAQTTGNVRVSVDATVEHLTFAIENFAASAGANTINLAALQFSTTEACGPV